MSDWLARVGGRETAAMWFRRVVIAVIAAAMCGCNPFEGTVFELRSPEKSVEQSDPNTPRGIGQDELPLGNNPPIIPNKTLPD